MDLELTIQISLRFVGIFIYIFTGIVQMKVGTEEVSAAQNMMELWRQSSAAVHCGNVLSITNFILLGRCSWIDFGIPLSLTKCGF